MLDGETNALQKSFALSVEPSKVTVSASDCNALFMIPRTIRVLSAPRPPDRKLAGWTIHQCNVPVAKLRSRCEWVHPRNAARPHSNTRTGFWNHEFQGIVCSPRVLYRARMHTIVQNLAGGIFQLMVVPITPISRVWTLG
jgi:hypothetical protein